MIAMYKEADYGTVSPFDPLDKLSTEPWGTFEREMPEFEYDDGDQFYIELGAPVATNLMSGRITDAAPPSSNTTTPIAPPPVSTGSANTVPHHNNASPNINASSNVTASTSNTTAPSMLDMVMNFLLLMGLPLLTKVGLYYRAGLALAADGFRYVTDKEIWVRFEPSHGYYMVAEKTEIIRAIGEWTVSDPLLGEKKWVLDTIPDRNNPAVVDAVESMYGGKDKMLQNNLPWLGAAVRQMTGQAALQTRSSEYDSDPELLNTPMGFLNLRTGDFTPHTELRGKLFRMCIACEYDPAAECPRFMRYLAEAHPGDDKRPIRDQLIPYLQYIAGTILLGYPPPHRNGFWIFGPSTTGKSVLANILRAIMGLYATLLPAEVLMKSRSESRMASALAELEGKRLVCVNEIPDGQLDDAVFKALTSNDGLMVRALYRTAKMIAMTHTLVCTTNHSPIIDDTGGAMFERMRPIPFVTRVKNPDPALESALRAEASGILNWMIAGARRVLAEPDLYREPPALVGASLSEYREAMDIAGNFIADCCEVCSDRIVISTTSLIAVFKLWTKRQNHLTFMAGKKLLRLLDEAGYKNKQHGSGRQGKRMRGIAGLTINEEYKALLQKKEHEEVKMLDLDLET